MIIMCMVSNRISSDKMSNRDRHGQEELNLRLTEAFGHTV